jgi:hypothetical protein
MMILPKKTTGQSRRKLALFTDLFAALIDREPVPRHDAASSALQLPVT